MLREALEAETSLMEGCGVAPLMPLFALPDLSAVNERRSAADADAARSLLAQQEDPAQQLILTRRIGCIYCQVWRVVHATLTRVGGMLSRSACAASLRALLLC